MHDNPEDWGSYELNFTFEETGTERFSNLPEVTQLLQAQPLGWPVGSIATFAR